MKPIKKGEFKEENGYQGRTATGTVRLTKGKARGKACCLLELIPHDKKNGISFKGMLTMEAVETLISICQCLEIDGPITRARDQGLLEVHPDVSSDGHRLQASRAANGA